MVVSPQAEKIYNGAPAPQKRPGTNENSKKSFKKKGMGVGERETRYKRGEKYLKIGRKKNFFPTNFLCLPRHPPGIDFGFKNQIQPQKKNAHNTKEILFLKILFSITRGPPTNGPLKY